MLFLLRLGLLLAFFGSALTALFLLSGHWGFAIRVMNYVYALLVVAVIAGLLHNDQK